MPYPASQSSSRNPHAILRRAEAAAAQLPPLMVAAQRVANTVWHGTHGRRRRGPGDTFWQFRHYQPGDPAYSIDWRQSAKSSSVFIREKEWIAAQSVWLWRDASPSMAYASNRRLTEKVERADLLTLALAALLLQAGEHVALAGEGRPPATGHGALERMAAVLSREASLPTDAPNTPPMEPLPRYANIVLFSDFLGPMEELAATVGTTTARGVLGHLVQILDPAEESLPFAGRIRFEGMEAEGSTLINRTENVRQDYRNRLQARREQIIALAHHHGWSFTLHHTDRPPQEALLALYGAMTVPRVQW
ncbi:MAG: DUF58 domain-containing protein [Alphaproteobacteria bacterium]|nr:DUF58 domain-containing protein [Alphaproteobacteria bacterium]MCZ6849237.1 DUF58 domain-containing protein [Alphaproteobacteria bacterium]